MSVISNAMFSIAALEIRVLEAQLSAQLGQIRDNRQWVGEDAERFYSEWDAEVRSRLHAAATKLEVITLIPFS
jgi:hypothetical protein